MAVAQRRSVYLKINVFIFFIAMNLAMIRAYVRVGMCVFVCVRVCMCMCTMWSSVFVVKSLRRRRRRRCVVETNGIRTRTPHARTTYDVHYTLGPIPIVNGLVHQQTRSAQHVRVTSDEQSKSEFRPRTEPKAFWGYMIPTIPLSSICIRP